jgi:hypothetical protein
MLCPLEALQPETREREMTRLMVGELRDLDVWHSESGLGSDFLVAYPGEFLPGEMIRLYGCDEIGFYSLDVPCMIQATVSLASDMMERN